MATTQVQDKQETPLAEQFVTLRYIGEDARVIYGKKVVPGEVKAYPFYVAELCAKEKKLFEIVDESPIARTLEKMLKPKKDN